MRSPDQARRYTEVLGEPGGGLIAEVQRLALPLPHADGPAQPTHAQLSHLSWRTLCSQAKQRCAGRQTHLRGAEGWRVSGTWRGAGMPGAVSVRLAPGAGAACGCASTSGGNSGTT